MANLINSLTIGGATGVIGLPYGVCSTDAATVAKTITVDNFSLEEGATVIVKFTNKNSAASPTLNVNSTGAKPIVRYGTSAASTSDATSGWRAGAVQMFTYDGTSWVRDFWENSIYSNQGFGHGYGKCTTAAATVAKTVSFSSYSLTHGGRFTVYFQNGNTVASPTLNINSKGAKPIYFNNAALTDTTLIKAGDLVTVVYDTVVLSTGAYHITSIIGTNRDDSAGPTANATVGASGTITVPYVESDETGLITNLVDRTITLGNFALKSEIPDVSQLASAMIFKGTLGTGGTITALPTATASTVGDTYKVITAGTYASTAAKVGDVFVCSSTPAWVLIPSGDEPSGTVTNVATGAGLTGGPVTSSGTIKANLVSETKSANAATSQTDSSTRIYPVSLDKNGKLAVIVPWTDTDTKVTAVGNHYTPAADTSAALSVDASSSTAASWNSTSLVTGVNLQRDAKGHVTGVTVDSIKMPANPNTDTKNTAGATASDSKLFLVGATSQGANPQTYSNANVYATAGVLNATKFSVNAAVTLEYNSTDKCLSFNFN